MKKIILVALIVPSLATAGVVVRDIGYQPTSSTSSPKISTSDSPPPKASPIAERCKSQAEFFAKTVAFRQGNADAKFVYDMAVDGYARAYGKEASPVRVSWFKKTILAVYDNPKYLFADAGASGMIYEDSCNANPGVMLIDE